MVTIRSIRVLLAFSILVPCANAATEPRPPYQVTQASNQAPGCVKDAFFGFLIGIIEAGTEMDANNSQLRAIISEFKCAYDIPFAQISRLVQHTDSETHERLIRLSFLRPMDIPIPYSVLFYHPGRIKSDSAVVFRLSEGTYSDSDWLAETSRVFTLELVEGNILVDIAGWLEVLFRAHLEDAWIRNVVFFSWDGHWIGMLQGTGRRTGRVFRSFFDFTLNAIIYPASSALDRAGRSIVPDMKAGVRS